MVTAGDSIMPKVLICLALLIGAFMVITFMPTQDDAKTTIYSHSNKSTVIYDDITTVMSSSAGTVTSGSSSGKLDADWAGHGFHSYAYVKNMPITDVPSLSGYTMTYTQTAHYHQHKCGDEQKCAFGYAAIPRTSNGAYAGQSCGWISVSDIATAIGGKHIDAAEWVKIAPQLFYNHPNWSSSSSMNNNIMSYFGMDADWEKANTGGADMATLKELFDKGGVVAFSATGTPGAGTYTYGKHIVLGVGYAAKDGNMTHLIVVDSSQGNTTNSYIAKSGAALTVGNYLHFVKLDKIPEPLKGSNGYLKMWPKNEPTSATSLGGSSNASAGGSTTSAGNTALLSFTGVINQYNENGVDYKAGCEYAASAMAFKALGFNATIKDMADIGGYGQDKQNPWTGVLGDIRTAAGRGTYATHIKTVCEKFAQSKGYNVTVASGYEKTLGDTTVTEADKTSFKNVLSLTEKGSPVIVWINIECNTSKIGTSATDYNAGGSYAAGKWLSGSHTVCLLGLDSDGKVVVADSDRNKIMHYDYNDFLKCWKGRGKMWVSLTKK